MDNAQRIAGSLDKEFKNRDSLFRSCGMDSSFEAMSWMMDKLNELDSKIDGLNNQNQSVPTEQWMNLKELCEYMPSHPAEQTVYGWTSCHLIPFHKRGKRIMFLKSEIDEWLHAGKIKSEKDLENEAAQFIKSKRNTRF